MDHDLLPLTESSIVDSVNAFNKSVTTEYEPERGDEVNFFYPQEPEYNATNITTSDGKNIRKVSFLN